MTEAPLCLPPAPLAHLPSARLLAGSCDCHFHVFTAASDLSPARNYSPRDATLAQWVAYADAVGLDRGVVVQPSVYGTDNRALLAALAAAPERLRAVVVVPPDTPPAEIARLDRAGVRGVRINLRNKAGLSLDAVPGLLRLVAPLGWHLQFLVGPEAIDGLRTIAMQRALPVVVDHLALLPPDGAAAADRFTALQRLLDSGLVYVKLSAPYRVGPAQAFARMAMRLAASHPERLVWGSDWPHSELFDSAPDDADLIDDLLATFETQDMRRRLLVENPTRLYWA